VQTAEEALEITTSNFAAGLGTQLDILQAASDVTRTRTTRLSAIYLQNVALARLAHACSSSVEALDFGSKTKTGKNDNNSAAQASDVAHPPAKLSRR
jgi:outer membrane protein TolC